MKDIIDLIPWALFSALVSAAVSYVTARATVRRTEWFGRVDDFTKELLSLSLEVTTYWTKQLTPAELAASAMLIRTRYQDLYQQIVDLRYEAGIKEFNSGYLDRLMGEIFDAATGADFDSPNRQIDPARAQSALEKIAELRREILNCRRRAIH